ncbi:MAG: hypothetical protein BM556_15860 [Bacteriovorax sp. MedPE-SWde]|mgnify:CR=1 FL=1|nr:MAG: hypothetical protein BM556_15860 [Bacteriovorax sp. MedPE-SWde]
MNIKLILVTSIIATTSFAGDLSQFTEKTLSLLPAKMAKVVKRKKVSVRFKDLNKKFGNDLPNPCETKGFVYGKYRLGKITLDKRFEAVITKGESKTQEFPCKQKTYYKLAQATLLHEASHAFDNKFLWLKRSSNDKSIRAFGFWDVEGIKNKNFNTYHKRSPDQYEYTKRKEFFAVNFEYFILDPEYQCRRPNLYNYYKNELNHTPFKNVNCEVNRVINFTTDNGLHTVSLDPDLIKEVQFLFAAEGPKMFSKWGHSMFKLVVCKNKNDTIEQCRKNTKGHVVLSFLAYIDEVGIDGLKGIFGKYPSRMMVSDINSVKRQYTRAEFRSLKSLPLKFNKDQRKRFLNHVLRIYWEYAGRYFFFANNCADEAYKVVQVAINERKTYKEDLMTPLGLYKRLLKKGLTDESILKDKKNAAASGFFYPSFGDKLNIVYEKVKTNFPSTDWPKKVEEYARLHPEDRRTILIHLLNPENTSPKKAHLYGLLGIEGHAQYLDAQMAMAKVSDFKALDELGDEYKLMLEETVELKNVYLYGAAKEERGYGIPLLKDLRMDDTVIREESDTQRAEIMEIVKRAVIENNQEVFKRYDMAKENINLIKTTLRNSN